MTAEERIETLTVCCDGDRLDAYVADHLDLSRTRVQALIEDGMILLDGVLAKKSERLEAGQQIEVRVPPPEPLNIGA